MKHQELAEYILNWAKTRNGGELEEALDNMRVGDYYRMEEELTLILQHDGHPPNWTTHHEAPQEEPRCAACGRLKSNHKVRHVFKPLRISLTER